MCYTQTKDELQRLRREVVKSTKSPKVSLAAQAVLRRVETEREDALNDLHRTQTERDSLRERLKVVTIANLYVQKFFSLTLYDPQLHICNTIKKSGK